MTEKCFDEGTIQAFLDGELDTDLLESVARHTATCDKCGLLLQEAEEESAFAFSALGNEFNTLVPTERIRTNLYDAIAQIEKPRKSFWQRLFGENFSFSNPSILAFASLLLVFGLFTTLYLYRENQGTNQNLVAVNNAPKPSESVRKALPSVSHPESTEAEPVSAGDDEEAQPKVKTPTYRPRTEDQAVIQNASYRVESAPVRKPRTFTPPIADKQPVTVNESLPGEESYVKTIATLTDDVNARKDSALRPSERVAFEKDLAVVNDAISKMQQEVRKNPKNEAAKQILRSSYQNKIDLLNSVADKNELMAMR